MKHARVKDLLLAYQNRDMAGVRDYLEKEDLIIEKDTWIEKMKKLLDSKKFGSMEAEIASIVFIFNLTKENGTENIRTDNSGPGSEN